MRLPPSRSTAMPGPGVLISRGQLEWRLEPECVGTTQHFVLTDFGAEMMAHLLRIGCNAVEPQKKAATPDFPGAGMLVVTNTPYPVPYAQVRVLEVTQETECRTIRISRTEALVNDARIDVTEWGERPPVPFLHANPCNA